MINTANELAACPAALADKRGLLTMTGVLSVLILSTFVVYTAGLLYCTAMNFELYAVPVTSLP
jgi:hypothetical protein